MGRIRIIHTLLVNLWTTSSYDRPILSFISCYEGQTKLRVVVVAICRPISELIYIYVLDLLAAAERVKFCDIRNGI
jgi:hypothetical protein